MSMYYVIFIILPLLQKAQELIDQGITGPEGALLCSPEEVG